MIVKNCKNLNHWWLYKTYKCVCETTFNIHKRTDGLVNLTQITIDHVDAFFKEFEKLGFLDFPFWEEDWDAKEKNPDLNELFNVYEKLSFWITTLGTHAHCSKIAKCVRDGECNWKSGRSANVID